MGKLVLALGVLFAFWSSSATEASTIVETGTATFVVPQNGTIELGGPVPFGSQGTFNIIDNTSFSGAGFALLSRTAVIDGQSYSIETALGTCPPGACHDLPFVTDTFNGPHIGSSGVSFFPISNLDPVLMISSSWTLQQLSPGSSIAVPSDYQVEINLSLPAGISAIPEPSTWAMLILGFIGICATTWRKSRNAALTA